MAEVVVQQAGTTSSNTGGVFGEVNSVFAWIASYWWVILLVVILIVGAVLIIYWLYLWDKENKKKDGVYLFFLNTLEACDLNARKDFVRKKRRWWMLLFSLFTSPIFGLSYLYLFRGESWLLLIFWVIFGFIIWLPLAIFWYKDLSMKILNVESRIVGYYRGHCRRQDGNLYLLLRVGKKWGVLDDNLLVRLPENTITVKTVKKKGRDGEYEEQYAYDTINIESYNWNERDNYIFIPMTGLIREGAYFYEPTLVQEGKPLDLRQKLANTYHLMTGIHQAEQTYSHLSKVTNNAVDANPNVVIEKKRPEKQRDVQAGDTNN